MEVTQIFEHFLIVSGLEPTESNCEMAGTGVLKGIQMTLCVMECVNLKTNKIKILGIHFSFNRSLANDHKTWRITEIGENATANNWR